MTTTASDIRKNIISKLPTLVLVLVALVVAYFVYQRWTHRPWTRNGQVRADIVKIAPRVKGYIVEVAVKDNQFVRKGELLFRIDPSSYQLSVDTAQVKLEQAREDVAALEAAVKASEAMVLKSEAGVVAARAMIKQQQAALANARSESDRATRLANQDAGSVENAEKKAAMVLEIEAAVDSARASLSQAEAALISSKANLDEAIANLGEPGEANVRIRSAKVQVNQANLNLEWTKIFAPADGFISNMNLLDSTFVSPGTPFALFVDASSFRVDAYFQETKLKHIQPGDPATITLMGRHDLPLKGNVESIGYAINPPNQAETEGPANLVPTIEPTFEWIRLAQRVPVRIRLEEIPEDLHLVSGMTASVSIQK